MVPVLASAATGTGQVPGNTTCAFGGGYSDAQSGNYWWYDDQATVHPWDPTGAGYPPLIPLPTLTNVPFTPIHDSLDAEKYKAADGPALLVLADSFWFFGVWFIPGDYLYISPDGWLSFDRKTAAPNPSATLPFDDNISTLICPYWCDFTPTGTSGWVGPAEPNCVYYSYKNKTITVEWYKVKHGSKYYTFEVYLNCGGGGVAEYPGCGPYYSWHLIQCRYQEVDPTSTNGWLTPANFAVGIEDHSETKGLYVDKSSLFHAPFGQHSLRFIYRKIYHYDMAAYQILSPGPTVLRYTPIEPKVVIGNIGREVASCAVNFEIDSLGTSVYNQNANVYNLYPSHNDTISFPCWSEPTGHRPAEIGVKYLATLKVSGYAQDECWGNNTLEQDIVVACDDSVTFDYKPGFTMGRFPIDYIVPATGYPLSGNSLIAKAAVRLDENDPGPDNLYGNFRLEIWDSDSGCDQHPKNRVSGIDQGVIPQGLGHQGLNWVTFNPMVSVGTPGKTGNFWVVMTSLGGPYDWTFMYSHSVLPYPFPHPCFADYSGPGYPYPVRSAYSNDGGSSWNLGTITGLDLFWSLQIMPHLSIQVPPMPPCYNDLPHDVATTGIIEPEIKFVQAESAYNCASAVANLGFTVEPESGFFYSHLKIDIETTTVYHESTAVSKLGQVGDPSDDPDSLAITYAPPWTPSTGGPMGQGVACTLKFYVKLGKIGPDNSDHCSSNDLKKKTVLVLWRHDVGVEQILQPMEGDVVQRDSTVFVRAEIRNYGFHEEGPFDVELTVRDMTPDTLIYSNIQSVTFIDWRGNIGNNANWVEITFPGWKVPWEPDPHKYKIGVRTLLANDRCPANDFTTMIINNDLAVEDRSPQRPSTYALSSVRPNPFAITAEIGYALPITSAVSLKIYDIAGKLVKTVVDEVQESAFYTVGWDGKDDRGQKVGGGIYILKMDSPGFHATKKFVLLR